LKKRRSIPPDEQFILEGNWARVQGRESGVSGLTTMNRAATVNSRRQHVVDS
jgi:hypothetical protein